MLKAEQISRSSQPDTRGSRSKHACHNDRLRRCKNGAVNGWEKEYVYYLAERKILNGKADGLFKPADNITRAEFVKILAAVSGQDVSKSTGTSFSDVNGKFLPQSSATRAQAANMITVYMQVTA